MSSGDRLGRAAAARHLWPYREAGLPSLPPSLLYILSLIFNLKDKLDQFGKLAQSKT